MDFILREFFLEALLKAVRAGRAEMDLYIFGNIRDVVDRFLSEKNVIVTVLHSFGAPVTRRSSEMRPPRAVLFPLPYHKPRCPTSGKGRYLHIASYLVYEVMLTS
jgi:hypothetical protein